MTPTRLLAEIAAQRIAISRVKAARTFILDLERTPAHIHWLHQTAECVEDLEFELAGLQYALQHPVTK